MKQSLVFNSQLVRVIKKRWGLWLDRRIPMTREQTLSHKSIFIFLNSNGLMFSGLLVLMLITAINYQNNLIYGFTFWFFSMLIVVLNYTYRNLANLKISSSGMKTCFVGDETHLYFSMKAEGKSHKSLMFGWPEFGLSFIPFVDGDSQHIEVLYRPEKRGWLKTDRLRLESSYPFGLFKTWSWLSIKQEVLVYPKPIFTNIRFSSGEEGSDEVDGHVSVRKGDDFAGVRAYQIGDELKNISWKQSAKGRGLQTKEYEQQEFATYWLSDENLLGADIEEKISLMAGWVIQAHQNGLYYGMKFKGVCCEPDNSDIHYNDCMKALALYGLNEQEANK